MKYSWISCWYRKSENCVAPDYPTNNYIEHMTQLRNAVQFCVSCHKSVKLEVERGVRKEDPGIWKQCL